MSAPADTVEPARPLFEPVALRHTTLKNRFVRSATYEGYGDYRGHPGPELADLYLKLAEGDAGAIITGFVFVSRAGRAIQPRQCGIHADDLIEPWARVVRRVRAHHGDTRLFMQIAHTGRQTRREATGLPVWGVSSKRCAYFRQKVRILDNAEIESIVREFADAARRAKEAGFDGVQIHAAHGYLAHQFLSPWTNTRTDKWADGPLFLETVIGAVRCECGGDFPVLVKLSWADDNTPGLDLEGTMRTVRRLETLDVDAVEISYGSMEFALNIIRGACPANVVLKVNPLFRRIPRMVRGLWKLMLLPRYMERLIPFTPDYNVEAALKIKAGTRLPVIPVGGIRSLNSMADCVKKGLSAVSLCRPLIHEPDLPRRIRKGKSTKSRCAHCNLCTVWCDGDRALKCYRKEKEESDGDTGR